jgi:hypothetical protein
VDSSEEEEEPDQITQLRNIGMTEATKTALEKKMEYERKIADERKQQLAQEATQGKIRESTTLAK